MSSTPIDLSKIEERAKANTGPDPMMLVVCLKPQEVVTLARAYRRLRGALEEFVLSHEHNETNPDYRPLSDTRGWCSACGAKVGRNEDVAKAALALSDAEVNCG